MKNKRNRKIDYQSSLFIGIILLIVGIGELTIDQKSLFIIITNILGALFLFGQAYFRYQRKQKLLKGF